jgi:hypothetical protein
MSGKFNKKEKQSSPIIDQLQSNPFFQLHRKYWQFDEKEKGQLLSKYPNDLSPEELLRLHHLNCLEHVTSEKGKAQFGDDVSEEEIDWLEGASKDLGAEIFERLLGADSPFRPRIGEVWQGEAGASEKREQDFQGEFYNMSLTHIGCLEVIRVDEQDLPKEITFLPFDEIRGAVFAPPSLYRFAKIFYEYERIDEVVVVPLIYGLSWHFEHSYLHDGSFTQWGCKIQSKQGFSLGIGLGHQDYKVLDSKGEQALFGLGSIAEFMIALEIEDPKFEMKCRARGMDPDDVIKQIKRKAGEID